MRTLAILAVVLGIAPAQTFVVDVANGRGTDFTSIAAALASVPSGSTLRVRAGNYEPFWIGTSVRILGEPGVTITKPGFSAGPDIYIGNLPADGAVVLQQLQLATWYGTQIRLDNCQGSVLLDRMSGAMLRVEATDCAHLQMKDCIGGLISLRTTNTNSVVESCSFNSLLTTQQNTITVAGGTLQLVNTTALANVVAGAACLHVQGGSARLLGSTALQPAIASGPFAAITGSGVVRAEPTVMMNGSQPLPPTIALTTAPMIRLTTQRQAAIVAATMTASSGLLGAIAISLPAGPGLLPGVVDAVWLDPASMSFVGVGIASPSLAATFAVPSGLTTSVRATFQAIAFDTNGTWLLSNPSFVLLP